MKGSRRRHSCVNVFPVTLHFLLKPLKCCPLNYYVTVCLLSKLEGSALKCQNLTSCQNAAWPSSLERKLALKEKLRLDFPGLLMSFWSRYVIGKGPLLWRDKSFLHGWKISNSADETHDFSHYLLLCIIQVISDDIPDARRRRRWHLLLAPPSTCIMCFKELVRVSGEPITGGPLVSYSSNQYPLTCVPSPWH